MSPINLLKVEIFIYLKTNTKIIIDAMQKQKCLAPNEVTKT